VTFDADISAKHADFCTKFYTTVKQQKYTLLPSLIKIISENDEIMHLCCLNQANPPFLSIRSSCRTGCKRTVLGSLKHSRS